MCARACVSKTLALSETQTLNLRRRLSETEAESARDKEEVSKDRTRNKWIFTFIFHITHEVAIYRLFIHTPPPSLAIENSQSYRTLHHLLIQTQLRLPTIEAHVNQLNNSSTAALKLELYTTSATC